MSTTVDLSNHPSSLDGNAKQLLIGGKWVPARSGETFESINPSTGEVLAELAKGAPEDVDAAVAAAREAFEGPWSKFTPVQRQNVLLRLADLLDENALELRLLDVLDMGSPLGRVRPTSSSLSQLVRYFAGWTTKIHGETVPNSAPGEYFSYTLKEPVGVVGAITPWNGPLGSAIWKLAPALATGCTFVLKPSEIAALSPLRLGELMEEIELLPPGVFNIVTGFGDVGAALASHADIDKVAFTGSTATGQQIVRAAAGNLKRVSLELGGKSPDVIFADADLDAAVQGAGFNGVFMGTGQSCCAGSRIFVERPIYDEFVERISNLATSLKVGNSLDPETQIGPLVSQGQLERVTGYMDLGKQEGAHANVGGSRLTDGPLSDGYFVAPTVFTDVQDEMRIATEEIFGPVACVMPFDTIEEVTKRANSTQYGLAGGVWTRDVGKAHRMAKAINTGVVWVNCYLVNDPGMPLGGVKMSGWGNELSVHALDEYLNVKSVWIRTDI